MRLIGYRENKPLSQEYAIERNGFNFMAGRPGSPALRSFFLGGKVRLAAKWR
jgi:hypothetical protein